MTNHETWIHDTSDKCTFPILSCYTCLPPGKCKQLRPEHIATVVSGQEFYSLFLDINVTTFTYINIVHKTRNSNLHDKLLPSTTSQYYYITWYYTACTQKYFALESLQKLLPSTTLYYKTCTKYSPVLLCTTKLAQSRSQYTTICSFKTGSRRQSDKKTILKHFLKRILKGKLLAPKLRNLLTNHYRSLDAATPIRFTRSSCKIQYYYACSRGTEQPWRSHYNAICGEWVANQNRTTRNDVGNCSSKTGSRRQS